MLLHPLMIDAVTSVRDSTFTTPIDILVNTPVRNHGGLVDSWAVRETVLGRMEKPLADASDLVLFQGTALQPQIDWLIVLAADVNVSTDNRVRAKGILLLVHSTDAGIDDALIQTLKCKFV